VSIPCKSERSQLSHAEFEAIRTTHHPAIHALDDKALHALKLRLREQRGKERTLARHKQRETRGKAEPRGKTFPGTADQPLKRKQIFAAALKRVNKELERARKRAARSAHVAAAQSALALRRSAQSMQHPAAGDTSRDGMQPRPSTRRRAGVPGSKIGSVSQATKVAQAVRDSKS